MPRDFIATSVKQHCDLLHRVESELREFCRVASSEQVMVVVVVVRPSGLMLQTSGWICTGKL